MLRAMSEFTSYDFFRSFMVSGLTFESLMHFEFILVCGVRKWSSIFFLVCVSAQFSQHQVFNSW